MRALFIVCVIDILGFGILIPLVPYMADRFGASPGLITPILGAYSLCQLIAAPFWGRMSDRFGRRPILMWSLSGACVSYLILGHAENLWWLLVSRILAGFMAGNISAAFAYASDISAPENRAKALGTVGAAIGIGFMLGPAIGGILAGNDEHTANFALPAVISACMSVFAISLVYFMLPESHAAEHRATRHEPRRLPLQLLRERPALRFIVSSAFLVTCSQAIFESIFAIWALNKFGFGPRTVGVGLFCLALIPVAMQGGLVRVLAPRLGEARLAIFAVFAYVTGLLIVAYSSHLPLA
ncbi:MAG: MFS transporter, partial [Gammaproteobacteria bacterium]